MFLFLAPLIMQVGIGTAATPVSPTPPELEDRIRRTAPMVDRAASEPAIATCLALATSDPAKARDFATEWIGRTKGVQRATGQHCLGVATGNLGDWASASTAFIAAREDALDPRFRSRMAALAGSALLARSQPAEALQILDASVQDASGDAELTGAIAIDRATALVALGRTEEAAAALAAARVAVPGSAQAWLLSATLARRMDDLPGAQLYIERAAQIDPRDPAIGLEAGVIAALGGRDAAAKRSFESVLIAAPDGPLADAANSYLAQLAQ